MKKILLIVIGVFIAVHGFNADAQKPKNYEKKTVQLADNLVKYSKEGNYNKTYNALRNIQKYEYKLQKHDLVQFYTDLRKAVENACYKYSIEEDGKGEMLTIVDALFTDELKQAAQ